MSFYSLELGDGRAASELSAQIEGAWIAMTQAATRAGKKTDYSSAVFRRGEPGAGKVTMYFTPAAELLAKVFGAVKCGKPSLSRIDLFLGDARAWDIHFPGERGKPVPDRIWIYQG